MVSKIANQYIEKWYAEGLKPTVADIVLLNDIGLAMENGPDTFSFSACPRYAVLNDIILREPIIAKRLWLEQCINYFSDNIETRLFFIAYVLGTPDNDLPDVQDIKKILKQSKKFRDEVLIKCTETQILAAVNWVLNGYKPDYDNIPEEEKEKVEEVFELPNQHSLTKQLLLQAVANKIELEAAEQCLYKDLENIIMAATLEKGVDVLKNENMKYAGKFYKTAGMIYKRLKEESKENGKV